jgi:uncharacterized protein
MLRNSILATSVLAVLAAACSDSPSAADLNQNPPATSGGSGGSVAQPSGGSSGTPSSSGSSTGGSGGGTVVPTGGSAGTPSGGGSGGDVDPTGGMGGSGGTAPDDPNVKRSGKFKMLVYSKTAGFRHDGSIVTGKALLTTIASELKIDPPTITEDNAWLANINDYELLFFLNTTGDIFNDAEQDIFEAWMKKADRGGAWCGTHSATDTENGWAFYSEVNGQYYDGHGAQGVQDQIQFEASALNPMFPALAGLPNPWQRAEEWYKFNSHQAWSAKPGFKILGRKAADGQPIMWTREHDNFRSFYTAIGHDGTVFQDPDVKKHLIGGIMWAVRREHCLVASPPAGCPNL